MLSDKPEYEHYIPQFLLRNFSHKFVCPRRREKGENCKKHAHKKGKFPGNNVINCLDMKTCEFSFEQSPVKRICGEYDMYVSSTNSTADRRYLEKRFGILEGQVCTIYRTIIKAYDSGESHVTLSRTEKNKVRKFIYLLQFRGPLYYERYNKARNINEYDHDDKGLLKLYMNKRGFTQPIDVWFESLGAILDIEMDANREWEKLIVTRMYFLNALHFNDSMRNMYLTICTPESPDDEFIFADNSSNIKEGSTKTEKDSNTGRYASSISESHRFSPLSPRLMLVLRSTFFPEPSEDVFPDITMNKDIFRQIYGGDDEKSILADLPVRKPYFLDVRLRYGRGVHESGEEPLHQKDDKFYYQFFPISRRQVHTINGLLLDHAYCGSRVFFNNRDAFLYLLGWFLQEPCKVGKNLDGQYGARQLEYLKNLRKVTRAQGKNVYLTYNLLPPHTSPVVENLRLSNMAGAMMLGEMMTGNKGSDFDKLSWLERGYYKLGGTEETQMQDMIQVKLMVLFWIRISLWSRKASKTVRLRIRNDVLDKYQRLPPRRFWMYLKTLRAIQSPVEEGTEYPPPDRNDDFRRGPEDLLVDVYPLVTSYELNTAMFRDFENNITVWRYPTGISCMIFFLPQKFDAMCYPNRIIPSRTPKRTSDDYNVIIDEVDDCARGDSGIDECTRLNSPLRTFGPSQAEKELARQILSCLIFLCLVLRVVWKVIEWLFMIKLLIDAIYPDSFIWQWIKGNWVVGLSKLNHWIGIS